MNNTPTLPLAVTGIAARDASGRDRGPDELADAIYRGTLNTAARPADAVQADADADAVVWAALRDAGIGPGAQVARLDVQTSGGNGGETRDLYHALAYAQQLIRGNSHENGAGAVDAVALVESGAAGAIALVVQPAPESPGDLGSSGGRVYAVIEGLAPDADAALRAAGLRPGAIGCLELTGDPADAQIRALAAVYRADRVAAPNDPSPDDLTCALSGIGSGGLASLLRAALSLHHRIIPPLPGWDGPAEPGLWAGSAFYALPRAKSWFLENGQDARRAAIHTPAGHILLREASHATRNLALSHSAPYLFLVAGGDLGDLLAKLDALEHDSGVLGAAQPMREIAARCFRARADAQAPYTLALIAGTPDELAREIERARSALPSAIAAGEDWSTPAGSYFTARPLRGKIAFVYPGAFSAYPRMGQDLFYLFPALHDSLSGLTSDLGRSVGDRWLYPRSLEKHSTRHWKAARRRLESHPAAMMEAGITSAVIFTRILRDHFGVWPDMAFGYSLGEGSMLWGLGVWQDGDMAHERLHSTPILRDRLFGAKQAVREMWGIAPDAPDDFWGVYFLSAPAEAVEAQVRRESRVYITHIDTPNETVIGGEPAACRRVIDALGCEHLHVPFDMVIHNELTFSEYPHFYHLHDYPVRSRPAVAFYSAADYAPALLESPVIAHNISRASCKLLDFPRLIHRVYEDGARIFIELGPRNACARWISETLGERDHLAVAINQPGTDDRTALVRALARLVSHGVALDLSPLYAPEAMPETIPAAASPSEATSATSAMGLRLDAPALALNRMHAAFLQSRSDALHYIGELLKLQMNALAAAGAAPTTAPVIPAAPAQPTLQPKPQWKTARPALFTEKHVQEFATGSVVACFGPDYAIYENRRAPRIPNGDLLLVSRVIEIRGERLKLASGSRAVSEYDMPLQPWFYRENAYPSIPYSIYMEMALQLCGFLSAYLGSTLTFPDLDFYFRNLDGNGTLARDADLRGKTITNHVEMTSSITMEGIILQKFTFALSVDGEVFYRGGASFGCFTAEAMKNQVGLDKGVPTQPWFRKQGIPARPEPRPARYFETGQPYLRLKTGQLDLVDEYLVIPDGGEFGRGYVYAGESIHPEDWFFANHFYQDPVMPGSLGVEAIMEAMKAFAIEMGLGKLFRAPRFRQALNHEIVWRYRGQVTQANRRIEMDVHIAQIDLRPDQVTIIGNANLWRDDGLRIYEVLGAALCIVEGAVEGADDPA